MTIRRLVQFLLGGLMLLAACAVALIAVAAFRRRQLVDLQDRRFRSYQLADELRHSSDDLTRMVRLFVATGDPRYESYYRTVLGIRDGTAPRPEHYERIYWDLYFEHGRPPRSSGPPAALLTLMQDAGYTAQELDSLRTALDRSNALAALEEEAFHAMHGEFRDAQGRFTIRRRPDPALARRLVFDSAYVHAKARIMRPIDATLGAMEERNDRELAAFLAQTRIAFFEIEGLLVLFLLLTMISYPLVRARILQPVARLRGQTLGLAGDLDRLAETAERIAAGEFQRSFSATTTPIRSESEDEIGDLSRVHDSMLGRLEAMGAAIAVMTGDLSIGRRRAESARDLSEQRFESMFRASPVALLVTDRETGSITAANDAMARLVGSPTTEALIGRRTLDIGLWGGDEELRRRTIPVVGPHNRASATLLPLRLPSGEIRTIEAMSSGYELQGRPYLLASLQDITDRLRAEELRRQAERQYAELFEGIRDVVYSLTPDGFITMLNPAFESVTRMPMDEWVGRHYAELIHPEDRPRVADQLRAALSGRVADAPPVRLRTGDGWRVMEFRSTPREEGGRVVGIFGIARDVSERASLEEQLRQSQKMQALGTLSGGIAHDFNNILTAINGNAELALEDSAAGDPVHRSLLDIRKAGRRAKDLVRQILIFSRREESRREAIDLAPVIEEAVRLLRTSLPKSITIAMELGAEKAPILGDATQVHQIMMNLGTNAGHAMGEKGTMTIRLERVEIGADHQATTAELHPGPYFRLTVGDTGHGMSPETLARIFEPFFTTKGNAGTGLGLSVVHGIMRDHEGAISVESVPGRGTTFHLCFPVTELRQPVEAPVATPRVKGNGQHILLVDDEEALVQVTSRILERLGYRCSSFTSASEALAALRGDPEAVDAVITDVSMPGMNGIEFALHAKEVRPDIPIALSTGAPDDRDLAERVGITVQFRKPMTMDELAEGVDRLLRGAARGGW